MRILSILFLGLILQACAVVHPGERGVQITLGHASDEVLTPGAYVWVPFIRSVAKVDVQIQKSEVVTDAQSKDMQKITTKVAINWSLNPEQVVTIYKTLGDEDEIYSRIIQPAVSEVFKAALAQTTAEEILMNRLQLKESIDKGLKARLTTYGVNTTDVNILDLSFTQEFMHAVESKQIAEQEAMQAKYTAAKAIQDAQAQVNLAKGQAESQKLLQTSLTTQMLQKLALDKWDGHFPQVMGNQALPFLNIPVKARSGE